MIANFIFSIWKYFWSEYVEKFYEIFIEKYVIKKSPSFDFPKYLEKIRNSKK